MFPNIEIKSFIKFTIFEKIRFLDQKLIICVYV